MKTTMSTIKNPEITLYQAWSTYQLDTCFYNQVHKNFDEAHTTTAHYEVDAMTIVDILNAYNERKGRKPQGTIDALRAVISC